MANPNELNLKNEIIEGVDFDNMPTGMASVPTPPQPGVYVFRLPSAEVIYHSFDTVEDPVQGQRVIAQFKDESALIMEPNGQPYHANISNRTRVINFKSGPVTVSDMAMLLKAMGVKPEQQSNPGYIKAMIEIAERRFKGEHTLTANCSEKRNVWKDGKEQPGRKGCGQRYSVDSFQPKNGGRVVLAIPKDDQGQCMTRFDCVCGASLRAWGQLRGFKSA